MAACRAALLAALLWVGTLPMLGVGTPQALPPQPSGGGREECQSRCGEKAIVYPFGVGPGSCALSSFFLLDCRDTKLFLGQSQVEVLNISLDTAEVQVMSKMSSNCYNATSGQMDTNIWQWDLTGWPFTFSQQANKFTVIGCQTLAYIGNQKNKTKEYMTGCVSFWLHDDGGTTDDNTNSTDTGGCSGMGCCQTAIPKDLQYYTVWFDDRFISTSGMMSNGSCSCSYATLMDPSKFNFSTNYLTSPAYFNETFRGQAPVLLQWGIGDDACDVARRKQGFACVSDNSYCSNAASGKGYICKCRNGFQGNPYRRGNDGCKDIDECRTPKQYGCYRKCTNKPGSFSCSCFPGERGNASIEGSCQKELFSSLGARLGLGTFAAVLVALFGFLGKEVVVQKRNSRRQAYFQEHGGQVLIEMLQRDGNNTSFAFYERGDIVKGTGNFCKENILGQGAHGTVYKATLDVSGTSTVVAVKRCKEIDKNKTMEFVRELVVLCSVSHPNVVKLLGCCLQFEAPMLVYEFVKNRTLKHLLHGRSWHPLTLATRLKIATDSAAALAHLHSQSILHGDVKPENILLGDRLNAKVSDFGCSTINDNSQVIPKGTLDYLDPEFLNDSKLTKKSDIYSFGVVLMELLTGKKPRAQDRKHLTLLFEQLLASGHGTLGDLLDADIVDEGSMVVIHQIAKLASRCVAMPGETRPTMEQVSEELRGLLNQMLSRSQLPQEIQGLGLTHMSYELIDVFQGTTTESFTGETRTALSTELAR